MAKKLRDEELWVAGCVQAALPGVIVGQHDDNTEQNVHDLDLSLAGEPTYAAMEVTSDVDKDLIEIWKAIRKKRGGRWIEPSITGGWQVHVRPTASFTRLSEELPALLQALEAIGLDRLPDQRVAAIPLEMLAEALGIFDMRQSGTDFPGSIYVMPVIPRERTGGWAESTGDAIPRWLSDWMLGPKQADNLRKLARSGAPERHLFVLAPGIESQAPFSVTDLLMRADVPLPTIAPTLPDEVTHVWIMSGWTGGRGFRWAPEGWSTFDNDAEVDSAALVKCTCQAPQQLGGTAPRPTLRSSLPAVVSAEA